MRFRRLCQEAAVAVYVILCQLRRAPLPDAPEWVFRDESYELITNMLGNEQNPVVLDSAISALGISCFALRG
jgi:hypothetical protein